MYASLMASGRRLTDEQRQEDYFRTLAARADEQDGVFVDDLNPTNDPSPSSDPRDLRVRAFVHASGVLWLTYATVRGREDGSAVVSALSIEAVQPEDAAVTVRMLVRFPVELLARLALERAHEEAQLDGWSEAYGLPAVPPLEAVARIEREAERLGVRWTPPRGKRPTPKVFYDAVALDAAEEHRLGRPVIDGLVARRGRGQSTIKRWIKGARGVGSLEQHGWKLGPTHPARAESEDKATEAKQEDMSPSVRAQAAYRRVAKLRAQVEVAESRAAEPAAPK